MKRGWIKVWRKFRDWEYYKDHKIKAVYLELLLTCDRAGNVKISIRELARSLGLSHREMRTIIKKLEKNNYIITQATQVKTQRTTQEATQVKVNKFNDLYNRSDTSKDTSKDTSSDTAKQKDNIYNRQEELYKEEEEEKATEFLIFDYFQEIEGAEYFTEWYLMNRHKIDELKNWRVAALRYVKKQQEKKKLLNVIGGERENREFHF